MPLFERSRASLRIIGDSLVPAEITQLLGGEPTEAHKMSEEIRGKATSHVRVAKTGMWRLVAEPREPEDLNGQIEELLGKLSNDLNAWAKIRETCRIDLFCGLFMGSGNDGVSLQPDQLLALGARGIELGLDVYDSSD